MQKYRDETNSPKASTFFPDYVLTKNQLPTSENVLLFKAALVGSLTGVNNALQKGAKPNFFYRQEDGKNSLHVAAENGFVDIVQVLLDNGAAIDSVASSSQGTAIIFASANDRLDIVKLLIKYGANVNASNCYGNTSLHEAARLGYVEVIRLLIECGADVKAQNHKGSTPVHFCCYGESVKDHPIEAIKLLLAAGADVNAVDNRLTTPMLVCCSSGR